jgi:hypothetical protein
VIHLIVLSERPGIQQHGKPFSGSKLALRMLRSDTLFASSSLGLRLNVVKATLKVRQRKGARGGGALNKRQKTPG